MICGMAAPKGNRYSYDALAYCKTKQHRQEAFKAYCKYVAEGNLKMSFHWTSEDGKAKATYRSVNHIIDTYPEDLELILLEEAEAINMHKWQKLAFGLCDGTIKGEGFVWINNMHNRFKNLGWNISQPKEDASQLEEQKAKQDKVASMADEINGNGS